MIDKTNTEENPWSSNAGPNSFDEEAEARLAELKGSEVKIYSDPAVEKALIALLSLAPDITDRSKVLYPGSAADSSFADVIGMNVVHIDPDTESMAVLKAGGYQCVVSTIEDYIGKHPDIIDMVISYNCGTVSNELAALVRSGGYVIANNWHESANAMGDRDDFEIVGAVPIGEREIKSPEAARKDLGWYACALLRTGGMITDPEEIDKQKKAGNISFVLPKEPLNTETLWLFRKKNPAETAV